MATVVLVLLAALAAAGFVYQQVGERRDRRRHPPPGRLVDAGAVRLHVRVAGAGSPPIVFLSGIAASSLNWTALQRALCGSCATCAYDRAGLGWSEPGPRGLGIVDHARQLKAALRAAGLASPYVLVAHSYGSLVAQVFTDLHESDVAGLVFLDPITWRDWIDPAAGERRRLRGGALFARVGACLAALGVVRFVLARFRSGREGPGRAVLSSFGPSAVEAVTRIFGQVGKMPPDTWDAIQAHWSRPRAFLAMARHFEQLPASARIVRDLEQARTAPWSMPAVVLGAASTTPEQQRHQRELAERSIRGRYERLETGHWVHLDDPARVGQAIASLEVAERGGAQHPS